MKIRKKTWRYWVKKFEGADLSNLSLSNKELLENIFLSFELNSIATPLELSQVEEKSGFLDIHEKYIGNILKGNYIHAESDVADNSVGVSPKSIIKYLTKFGEEGLTFLPDVLHALNWIAWHMSPYLQDEFFNEGDPEDTFFDWNEFFKGKVLFPSDRQPELSVCQIVVESLLDDLQMTFKVKDKAAAEEIVKNVLLIGIISRNKDNLTSDGETSLRLIERFYRQRKELWKKELGFMPNSKTVLLLYPKKFSVKFLESVEKIYGSKNLSTMPQSHVSSVASLMDEFGQNSHLLPFNVVSNGKHHKREYFEEEKNIDLKQLLNISKMIDLTVFDFLSLGKILSQVKDPGLITRMIKGNKDASFTLIQYYLDLLKNDDLSANEKTFALSLSPEFIKIFHRARGHNPNTHELRRFYEVWDERSNDQTIPVIRGSYFEYTFEIINKIEDTTGMILGYATDCCQTIGGQADSCVRAGYSDPHQSFLCIRKDGKIVGQSWIWSSEDNNGDSFIVFDSVEILGRAVNNKIVGCYAKAADMLKKEGYCRVCVGIRNALPTGNPLYDLTLLSQHEVSDNGMTCRAGLYSDAGTMLVFNKDFEYFRKRYFKSLEDEAPAQQKKDSHEG